MSNFSRSKKYEDLHKEIQTDGESNIQSNELSQYANKLNEIDSGNFNRMDESNNQMGSRARVNDMNQMTPNQQAVQQPPMTEQNPYQQQVGQNQQNNDYMNEFISEVKDYNMKQGLRTAEDTQMNILNEIRSQNPNYQQQAPVYQENPNINQQQTPVYQENQNINQQQAPVYQENPNFNQQQAPVYQENPNLNQQQVPVYQENPNFNQQQTPLYQEAVTVDTQTQVNIPEPVYQNPEVQPQANGNPFVQHEELYHQAEMQTNATITPVQTTDKQYVPLKNHEQISSEIERYMSDPNYIPVPEVEQQITGNVSKNFDTLQQQYLADSENDRQKKLHDEMLMETQQLKIQIEEYEDDLEVAQEKVTNANRILNFILILLILALLVILGIAVFWILSSKGII